MLNARESRAVGRAELGGLASDDKRTYRVLKHVRSEEDHRNFLQQGFTLVELLIVIVILGILAGIVVFAVGNLTSNAQSNACATEKSTIITADEAYKAQNPTTGYTDTAGLVSAGLLKSTPLDYQITASTAGSPSTTGGVVSLTSANPGKCT
jgi:general secretion pathway protein G